MKNFKLLLATTAILSTGALMANAIEGESAQVDVKAELIKARVLTPTPLDFGRIVFSQGVYELAVDVHPAKSETASGPVVIDEVLGGTAYVLTQGKRGTVTGATCSQLDYPDTSSENLPFTTVPDDAPSNLTAHFSLSCLDSDDEDDVAEFHSTMSIFTSDIVGSNNTEIPAGKYEASFTVTAIYPEETTDTDTNP